MRFVINAGCVCVLVYGSFGAAKALQAQIRVSGSAKFTAQAGSLGFQSGTAFGAPQNIGVGEVGGSSVPFKFAGAVTPDGQPSNVFVVSPSSGLTPALLRVALNPNVVPYLPSRTYAAILQFATTGQTCPARPSPTEPACPSAFATLILDAGPAPNITGIVSAATLQPSIAPGEIVFITGTNLSSPPLSAQFDSSGLYPTTLGNSTVTFNAVAAPLLSVSPTQIEAMVPYEVAGQSSVDVVVTHNRVSPTFSTPVVDTAPGIFTADQSGSGQGVIQNIDPILSGNISPNSEDNPAPKGTSIAIFATGAGVWRQKIVDRFGNPLGNENIQTGSIILAGAWLLDPDVSIPRPAAPVSLTIGGQPARIRYAGPAPYEISGKLKVIAVVPDNIDSGPQPLILTVGDNSSPNQQVTVAVQ
jgi:uncharacterized protein (TIGR03437 family)